MSIKIPAEIEFPTIFHLTVRTAVLNLRPRFEPRPALEMLGWPTKANNFVGFCGFRGPEGSHGLDTAIPFRHMAFRGPTLGWHPV